MIRPHFLVTFVSIALATLALTVISYGQAVKASQTEAQAPPKRQAAVPVTMTECEGTNNCATWTFLGKQGDGQWPSGEVANLTVESLDGDNVVIHRADSTGSSAGLTAVYNGTRHAERIGGEFTSSWPGHWDDKAGNWYATIGKAAQTPPSIMRVCNPGIICGTWKWNDGHYDGVWDGIPKTATITVASFSPDSVIMNRTDNDDGRTFVLTGKISSQGNSIINGKQLRVDDGAAHTFTATWGAAFHARPDHTQQPVIMGRPVVCYPWFFTVVCQ